MAQKLAIPSQPLILHGLIFLQKPLSTIFLPMRNDTVRSKKE